MNSRPDNRRILLKDIGNQIHLKEHEKVRRLAV